MGIVFPLAGASVRKHFRRGTEARVEANALYEYLTRWFVSTYNRVITCRLETKY